MLRSLNIFAIALVLPDGTNGSCEQHSECNMAAGEFCGGRCGEGDNCCKGPCKISESSSHSCLTCSKKYNEPYSMTEDCTCLAEEAHVAEFGGECYSGMGAPQAAAGNKVEGATEAAVPLRSCEQNSECNMAAGEFCGGRCGEGDNCCKGPCKITESSSHSCLTCSKKYNEPYSMTEDCTCLAEEDHLAEFESKCYMGKGAPQAAAAEKVEGAINADKEKVPTSSPTSDQMAAADHAQAFSYSMKLLFVLSRILMSLMI